MNAANPSTPTDQRRLSNNIIQYSDTMINGLFAEKKQLLQWVVLCANYQFTIILNMPLFLIWHRSRKQQNLVGFSNLGRFLNLAFYVDISRVSAAFFGHVNSTFGKPKKSIISHSLKKKKKRNVWHLIVFSPLCIPEIFQGHSLCLARRSCKKYSIVQRE